MECVRYKLSVHCNLITGLLLRHYTQNIDTLERVANIPEEKIVEAHGTFYTSHCLECRKQYNLEFVKGKTILLRSSA